MAKRKKLTDEERYAREEELARIAEERIELQHYREWAHYEREFRKKYQFPWILPPIEDR